jgi:dihydrofolate reductase
MRKIFMSMMVSLDGYFEGRDHDLSWHNVDDEFVRFAVEQLGEVDLMLFGRRTYDLMAGFWPTPEAKRDDPATAEFMNALPKVVVSHHPFKADWNNTSVLSKDVAAEIRKLKDGPGKDIAIFGSNELCVTLLPEGLIDEFRIMVNPVAIGEGTALFAGIKGRLNLKLTKVREFRSGNVMLYYKP